MPRVLTWTGAAGNLEFGTPGNWTNQATGRPAKLAPGRAATVELSGEGTISGSGTVAVMDVIGGTGGFLFENATISAATIVDTDGIALSDSRLSAKHVTIGSDTAGGTLSVSGGSTLSSIGGALNISVGSGEGNALLVIGKNGIAPGVVALGGGTLQLGGLYGGSLDLVGGDLTGGLRADIDFGAEGGGSGSGTINAGTIAIGGMLALGQGGGYGYLLLESGSISAGVLAVGVDGGYGGVTASGGTVSAGALEVGDGGTGTFSAMDANITVGRPGGVGLAIASAPSSPGGEASYGTMNVDATTLTVIGATDIGFFGSGTLQFGGGPGSLTTKGGVMIGNYTDGGTGLLVDYGSWLDTGSVVVDNGQLEISGGTSATINGDLTIGGGPAGALASMTETYASLTVNGTFDVAGGSVAQSMGDASIGPSGTLSATSVVVGGDSYDATLTVGGFGNSGPTTLDAGTVSVAAGSVLQMGPCVVQFGTGKAGVAASVSGSLLVTLATLTVTGGLDLNGPSADPTLMVEDHGTVSITSSGAAVMCNDAGFEVLGSASVLTAIGNVDLSNGSQGVVNGGTLTVSAAHDGTAIMIDGTSMLSDSGTVTLTGGAIVDGQLLMQAGVFSASGDLTVSAGGTLSGSGSVTASVNNMGGISAAGGSLSFMGSVGGAGTFSLAQGGTLALLGAVGLSATVDFATSGTITLGEAAQFHGAISGWGSGDVLDLLQVEAVSESVTGQVLTLYNSANAAVASLRFDQPITTSNFVLHQDGHGNTLLTYHA